MRASGRWMWAGRLAALFVAIVIPACTSSGGGGVGNSNGILWLSQSGSGTNVGGPSYSGTSLWVDPNSGLGGGIIGISQIITSTDDVTYARFNASTQPPPFNQFVFYILGVEHPLSTITSTTAITSRESTLQGMLNGFRTGTLIICVHLPNANGGGGGGGGGIGGIGGIGLTQGALPGHGQGTKSARAHCKHYSYFHTGFPGSALSRGLGPGPANNPAGTPSGWTLSGGRSGAPHFFPADPNDEGDLLLETDPGYPAYMDPNTIHGAQVLVINPNANKGRLGKIGMSAAVNGWCEFNYAGAQWKEPIDVYNQMIQDAPDVLKFTNWTNVATGHWRGGQDAFHWSTMYIIFPNPAY